VGLEKEGSQEGAQGATHVNPLLSPGHDVAGRAEATLGAVAVRDALLDRVVGIRLAVFGGKVIFTHPCILHA
jgi:hypothetical protein